MFPFTELQGFDRLAYAGSVAEHLEGPPVRIGHNLHAALAELDTGA